MTKLNYQELSSQLEDWAGISSCSEIHGLISGLASVGLGRDYAQLESIIMRHVDESTRTEAAQKGLHNMHKTVMDQLETTEFAFETLIPEDDEELYVRVEALGQWCQGFLVGFGTGVKSDELNFSVEAQEALRDLVEISNVTQDQDDETEDQEVALTELEEYVRTAVMLLYSEFVLGKDASKNSSDSDILH